MEKAFTSRWFYLRCLTPMAWKPCGCRSRTTHQTFSHLKKTGRNVSMTPRLYSEAPLPYRRHEQTIHHIATNTVHSSAEAYHLLSLQETPCLTATLDNTAGVTFTSPRTVHLLIIAIPRTCHGTFLRLAIHAVVQLLLLFFGSAPCRHTLYVAKSRDLCIKNLDSKTAKPKP